MSKDKDKPKKKKVKTRYIDDGHTVYSMENLPGAVKRSDDDPLLDKKERRAAIRAALAHYMPIVFMTLACFAVTGVLLYFWLMY